MVDGAVVRGAVSGSGKQHYAGLRHAKGVAGEDLNPIKPYQIVGNIKTPII